MYIDSKTSYLAWKDNNIMYEWMNMSQHKESRDNRPTLAYETKVQEQVEPANIRSVLSTHIYTLFQSQTANGHALSQIL